MNGEYRAGRVREDLRVGSEVICGDVGEGVDSEVDETFGLFGEGQGNAFRLSSGGTGLRARVG